MSASRQDSRLKRKMRIRKKLSGTAERPRLCIFKSTDHIYGQLIDDGSGKTLLSTSSLDKDLKSLKKGGSVEAAKTVGAALAERALSKGISSVVFDRNGFLYHGRVKAFADAAREKGLKF